MEDEIRGVNITWLIENNAKYIIQLWSPVITIDEIDRTNWKLGFHRKSDSTFTLNIKRELEDNGPIEIELNYEFFVECLDSTSSHLGRIHTFMFQKDQFCPEIEVDHEQFSKAIFPDSIIIRCNIYKQGESISKSSHISVQTGVKTELQTFVGVVENFTNINKDSRSTLKTVLSQSGEKIMTVDFYYSVFFILPDIEDMFIQIPSIYKQPIRFFNLKFFVLNSSGKKTGIKREEEFLLESSMKFSLPKISKQILMHNEAVFLKNGILSIHFEITFFSEIEYQKIEKTVYENDFISELKQTDFSTLVALLTSKDGTPYDMKLQTATEEFPAHIAILSVHSPIFDAMFKTNMKESIQKCVQLDDMDAETVKNMLVFMYSDTLEVPYWKSAMNLYLAADKYQILNLKNKCGEILRQCVYLSNCCVLLLLADIYQDKDLKRAVHRYITPNGKFVIYCNQWRELEKNQPHLVLEYFHELFSLGLL